MLVPSRIIGALFISIACCLVAVGQPRLVAITFDDLPIADIPEGTIDPSETRTINRVILESLRRHQVPATGFVIEKRVEDGGEIPGREILSLWAESGNDLGNH